MTVAIQFSFRKKEDSFVDQFIYTCFSVLAKNHQEINFLFLSDCLFDNKTFPYPNQQLIPLPSGFNNSFIQAIWHQYKLPAILKRYAADYFISNTNYCRKRISAKQIVWINEATILNNKRKLSQLSKSEIILTVNDYFNKILTKSVPGIEKKVFVTGIGLNHLNNFIRRNTDKEIKNKYSDGADYFVCCSTPNQFNEMITCLKAFSQFKKWQKSNMQLLFLLDEEQKNKLSQSLANYKYKSDVKLIDNKDQIINKDIMSAAYAIINTSAALNIPANMLTAIELNKPLIIDDQDYFKSSFNEAVIYAKIDENEIAKKLILVYKDENYRNEIIENARLLTTKFEWNAVSEKLWSRIITSTEN